MDFYLCHVLLEENLGHTLHLLLNKSWGTRGNIFTPVVPTCHSLSICSGVTNSLSCLCHHPHTCCITMSSGTSVSTRLAIFLLREKLRNTAGFPLYTCWPLKVCGLFVSGKRSLRRANQLKASTNMLF